VSGPGPRCASATAAARPAAGGARAEQLDRPVPAGHPGQGPCRGARQPRQRLGHGASQLREVYDTVASNSWGGPSCARAARRKVAKHSDIGEDHLRYAARAPIVFRVMSSSSATSFGTGCGSHGSLAEAALADADGPRLAVGSAPERSAARPEIDRSNVNCLEVRRVFAAGSEPAGRPVRARGVRRRAAPFSLCAPPG
jgi:hypothetical protein